MSADTSFVIALDLGGTHLRLALADGGGKLLRRHTALTRAEEGQEQAIERINDAIREIVSGIGFERVRGLGLAVAGAIDPASGVLFISPNLPGWINVPLKSIWEQEFKVPVWIGNDANLAALGEHRFGAGGGASNLVYLTVSTGIGGGVILDGRLFLGAHGLAAELGHMTVDPAGPRCKCGSVGCLETWASGTAIARSAVERISTGQASSIISLVNGDLGKVTAETVATAARAGDTLANAVMQTAGRYLGIGVVNLLHIFDPELVIIGGGVAKAADLIFGPVRQVVAERAMPPYREVRLLSSALGDDAGLVGAVAVVLGAG